MWLFPRKVLDDIFNTDNYNFRFFELILFMSYDQISIYYALFTCKVYSHISIVIFVICHFILKSVTFGLFIFMRLMTINFMYFNTPENQYIFEINILLMKISKNICLPSTLNFSLHFKRHFPSHIVKITFFITFFYDLTSFCDIDSSPRRVNLAAFSFSFIRISFYIFSNFGIWFSTCFTYAYFISSNM